MRAPAAQLKGPRGGSPRKILRARARNAKPIVQTSAMRLLSQHKYLPRHAFGAFRPGHDEVETGCDA